MAAIGTTGTLSFLLSGIITGISSGFTVLVAQNMGTSRLNDVRHCAGSAIILSVIITAVLSLLSVLGMQSVLLMMKTPKVLISDAYRYIVIIYGGMGAQIAYQLQAGLLRALGNSKAPLMFLIISAVLNIAFDLLFICVLQMGTAGASYATILSQAISALLCFVYIVKCVPALHLKKEHFRPDFSVMSKQLRVGAPMAFQYAITAIGTTMVQVSLNMLNQPLYITAFTTGSKIENLTVQAYAALGTASATYTAQNIGAGKYQRIRRGFCDAMIIGCIYAVITGIPLAFAGKYLTHLFIPVSGWALPDAVGIYLTCSAAFGFSLVSVNVFRNALQGMGLGFLPFLSGVFELLGRGCCAIISQKRNSFLLVCLASPIAWTLATLLLICVYFYKMRQLPAGIESCP